MVQLEHGFNYETIAEGMQKPQTLLFIDWMKNI